MHVLAIDTCSAICAVALHDGATNTLLAAESVVIGTGHAQHLMPMIDAVLRAGGVTLRQIDRIGCAIGPGSFTGVRVGVAAARGFGQALNCPLVGLTTLQAIAMDVAENLSADDRLKPLRIVIDARRDQVYAQDFATDGRPLSEPALLSLEAARIRAEAFILAGSGARLLDQEMGQGIDHPHHDAATAKIATFARLAALSASQSQTSLTISPLYLRGADAKPQQGFALARRSGD
jgi:tRNA threonylcarbamoyladenosine biosynthesis protein TsaB